MFGKRKYIKRLETELINAKDELRSYRRESEKIYNNVVRIKNSKISSNVTIDSSVIQDSSIDEGTSIGPFSHIHKNSIIGKENRIGNYTEIKNSILGNKTKAAHLSYIGDCIIGSEVNIGCGSIIVNYDGMNKTTSVIKDKVFIGSNSNIISPIIIEENSFIAAGSTVTQNIKANSFVIARSKETIKENRAQDFPYYQNKNKRSE